LAAFAAPTSISLPSLKDAEAAKKAALDAGLSSFEVTTEEHQRAAAALPEGAIIAQQLARGETLTAEAVYLIDNGLATGRGLNVMAQGTRKRNYCRNHEMVRPWGSPLTREQGEAKADQAIKATRPHWGWFIVFVIVAVLWVWFITSTIANFWQIGFASGSTAAGPPLGQRTSIMVPILGRGFRLRWPFRPI
jgi:hypothetical protein